MFERFSQSAREVVVQAQSEARFLSHNYIGTEHLLLGLLRTTEEPAARVLMDLGIEREEIHRLWWTGWARDHWVNRTQRHWTPSA